MKKLAISTIIRAFTRKGWWWEGNKLMSRDPNPGTRIFGHFEGGMVKLFDARLRAHPNAHLVSYWGPWERVADLERDIEKIKDLYHTYCGTFFAE
jgi:hypothetical protein